MATQETHAQRAAKASDTTAQALDADQWLFGLDLDPDERCPSCDAQMVKDEEGDWNHVRFDDATPVALTIGCD